LSRRRIVWFPKRRIIRLCGGSLDPTGGRRRLSASLGKERFLREIKVAAALQHPHILPLYDCDRKHPIPVAFPALFPSLCSYHFSQPAVCSEGGREATPVASRRLDIRLTDRPQVVPH